jgi:hypothetical protein
LLRKGKFVTAANSVHLSVRTPGTISSTTQEEIFFANPNHNLDRRARRDQGTTLNNKSPPFLEGKMDRHALGQVMSPAGRHGRSMLTAFPLIFLGCPAPASPIHSRVSCGRNHRV